MRRREAGGLNTSSTPPALLKVSGRAVALASLQLVDGFFSMLMLPYEGNPLLAGLHPQSVLAVKAAAAVLMLFAVSFFDNVKMGLNKAYIKLADYAVHIVLAIYVAAAVNGALSLLLLPR